MSKPSEHKTVQARILSYAQEIGWSLVSRDDAELRRGQKKGGQECPPSLFFEDLLHAKMREFNLRYAEAEGALPGKFRHLHTDIYGNREFVEHLRKQVTFAVYSEEDDLDKVTATVESLFNLLEKAFLK